MASLVQRLCTCAGCKERALSDSSENVCTLPLGPERQIDPGTFKAFKNCVLDNSNSRCGAILLEYASMTGCDEVCVKSGIGPRSAACSKASASQVACKAVRITEPCPNYPPISMTSDDKSTKIYGPGPSTEDGTSTPDNDTGAPAPVVGPSNATAKSKVDDELRAVEEASKQGNSARAAASAAASIAALAAMVMILF
jgi:hypothetical protein